MGLLVKLAGSLRGGLASVAAGKSGAALGMQSPHLGTAMVRVGRFLYVSTLGWIGVSWYTGYVNEHTKEGEVKFILPLGAPTKAISTPDRRNRRVNESTLFGTLDAVAGTGQGIMKTVSTPVENAGELLASSQRAGKEAKGRTLVAISPSQLGVPGSAVSGYLWTAPSGQKQTPPYDATRYRELLGIASTIAHQFHLKITSGYRPQSSGSLHSYGLAFDMVGRETDMKRAAAYAHTSPGMFQEIFVHNEGSGLHLHIGFYPDAGKIFNKRGTKYNQARPTLTPSGRARTTIV